VGLRLEDGRVSAPDQLGELFVGVADRLDRSDRGWLPLGEVPDDDEIEIAPLVEVATGKRPVEDDGGGVPPLSP